MCRSESSEKTGVVSTAVDDNENITPTQWWTLSAQTAAEVTSSLSTLGARITNIQVDNLSPYPFTVTYVLNSGTYHQTGWTYLLDADRTTLEATIGANSDRLISLKAYDTGGGNILYSAAMIKNYTVSQDYKTSIYKLGATESDLNLLQRQNYRLVTVQSYVSNGQTLYAAIAIANTGLDSRPGSTWFPNLAPSDIEGHLTNARILDVTHAGNGHFNVALESCAGGCPRWAWTHDKNYADTVTFAQTNGLRIVAADTYPGCGSYCFATTMLEGSTGSDHGTAPSKLRGFVDLHTHPLSNVAFGGKLIYGGVDVGSLLPSDPNCSANATATDILEALGHDGSTHGFDSKCGDAIREKVIHGIQEGNGANDPSGDARGAPDFPDWPTWNDITHQKMWVDWLRRAHDGGQRVLVALAVNNKTIADSTAGPFDYHTDDVDAADLQIQEIKKFVNRHGPLTNDDFMELAFSSSDVQRIVQTNRMAVVIGAEIDAIGNFYANSNPSQAQVTAEVDRLYNEGVRYIFPIHVIDNAFGGTAIYDKTFNYSNKRESGRWWNIGCSLVTDGIDYNYAPGGLLDNLPVAAAEAFKLPELLDSSKVTTVLPELQVPGIAIESLISDFQGALQSPPAPPPCTRGEGHVNSEGLTSLGHFALQEMMRHGMLVDIDHMSQSSMDAALTDAERIPGGYPLNSGHANIREHGGTERNPSCTQYARIANLHGMAGVGSAKTTAAGWIKLDVDTLHAMGGLGNLCPPSQSTAGPLRPALAFGTDTDGLAMGMPPTLPRAQGTPATMFSHETGTGCVTNCEHDEEHVFYRDALNTITNVFYDQGSNILNVIDLATPFTLAVPWVGGSSRIGAAPAIGNPATMFTDNNMQQHIFYRDTLNDMVHVFFDPNTGLNLPQVWGAGAGATNFGPSPAGDPATLYYGRDNQQHIFYRDRNNDIQHVYFDPAAGSVRWDSTKWGSNAVGTPATLFSHETGFGCIFDCANDQQHLLYRNASNKIMHAYYDMHDRQFHAPEEWAGNVGSDPATLFTPNKQQHVFYRQTTGEISHVYWDPKEHLKFDATVWGNGAVGNPSTMFSHETGDACITGCAHDQQHVFFRTASNEIMHSYYDMNDGTFNGPEAWAQGAGSDPATLFTNNKQQHLFYVGTDGNLYHVFFDPSSGMHGPDRWAGNADGDFLPPVEYGPGLTRSESGTRMWDINYDGVAHYGMLPDFLQSMRGAPIGQDLADNNLMYGAQYFVDTWKFAEQQSFKVLPIDQLVKQLVVGGKIDQNLANSLLAKLAAAADARARGQCNTAANIYGAFINEVTAQDGKKIDSGAAAILISVAQYLIDHCP
jgi:microsomal dipeptidase-like Zn-dependent dipeptidase